MKIKIIFVNDFKRFLKTYKIMGIQFLFITIREYNNKKMCCSILLALLQQ